MKRREFLKCSGTGLGAGLTALSLGGPADARQATQQQTQPPAKPDNPQQPQP
ncbi:MAG: twin-arginine translocation signal domain-containing protein, partial [Acidobacteria bacterium]|nr:twin-arginine translocation signal domain-containing protein [Acidobacteriota bacterium]